MRLFGLGGGKTADNPEAKLEREASARSLESGGLPIPALQRLREQAKENAAGNSFFTSDLSVNELLLTHASGLRPMGQVMGSTVYHIGWQFMPQWSWTSGELTVLTEAYYNARHLALNRLRQEAAELKASGVIGVRIDYSEYEWGPSLLEFKAIGTAVFDPAAPAGAPPFLSDLSGQDYALLRSTGYRPVGICVGNCSYYQVPTWSTMNATTGGFFGGSWANQELQDYTQALYDARSLAMERMESEARALGASGVVGANVDVKAVPREVDMNNQRRIDMMYHYTAIGTAIVLEGHATHQPVKPILPIPG